MSESLVFPIFPLDEVILVPGSMLPLHVFEERYRRLVADALGGDRRIAMVLPLPGHSCEIDRAPPVHPVCGLGRVVHHQPYDDGRSDIVLHGQTRMRILEELESDRPYRLARGVALPDEVAEGVDLGPRAARLLRRLEGLPADDLERLSGLSPGQLADAVLAPLPLPVQDKQRILARPDVAWRLDELEICLDLLQGSRHRPEMGPEDPRLN
jgi:Lon protease-like protein